MISISIVISDSLIKEPIFIDNKDSEVLIKEFVKSLPVDKKSFPVRFGRCIQW